MTGQPVWLPEQPKNKRVRPRPINPDERLPIVFLATKRDGHGEPLEADLVEFLKAQEAEHAVLIAEQKKVCSTARTYSSAEPYAALVRGLRRAHAAWGSQTPVHRHTQPNKRSYDSAQLLAHMA